MFYQIEKTQWAQIGWNQSDQKRYNGFIKVGVNKRHGNIYTFFALYIL